MGIHLLQWQDKEVVLLIWLHEGVGEEERFRTEVSYQGYGRDLGGERMTKEEFKEKILNLYIELIEKHKGDKQALYEIDMVFDKPLEELNK